MNAATMELMRRMLKRVAWTEANVLDVGALDVNGTYRGLVERRGWWYMGLDIVPGPNVDIVSEDPLHYPIPDGEYDIVISGSTIEHVTAFWEWVPELVRVLRPGGFLALVAPHGYREHRYPIDCWRIFPQGMEYLLRMVGLQDIRVGKSKLDTVGSGFKPCPS